LTSSKFARQSPTAIRGRSCRLAICRPSASTVTFAESGSARDSPIRAKNPRKHNYVIYDVTLAKASRRVLERRRLGAFPEHYTILDKYEVALIG
jgi:hypothetical protein